MFIQTEITPNPLTLKFLPGRDVLGKGTLEFKNKDEASSSPLAEKLFGIENVTNVFLGSDFISVTKNDTIDWDLLKPEVLSTIMDFFSSGKELVNNEIKTDDNTEDETYDKKDEKIVNEVKKLLDEKIRPAVAQDGGDIKFVKFSEGIVFLQLRGACAGCPSSTMTLKSGIENMFKYYIPEIVSVEAVN